VLIGSQLLTFWDNLSVLSLRVKQSKKMEMIDCPEILVTINQCCVTSQKSKDFIYTVVEA
jgi:hypothetical protein